MLAAMDNALMQKTRVAITPGKVAVTQIDTIVAPVPSSQVPGIEELAAQIRMPTLDATAVTADTIFKQL